MLYKALKPRKSTPSRGGGCSRKSDILLKTPPRAKFEKGGGGFKGVFRCAGVSSAGRAPRPPKSPTTTPHQMKYIGSSISK